MNLLNTPRKCVCGSQMFRVFTDSAALPALVSFSQRMEAQQVVTAFPGTGAWMCGKCENWGLIGKAAIWERPEKNATETLGNQAKMKKILPSHGDILTRWKRGRAVFKKKEFRHEFK